MNLENVKINYRLNYVDGSTAYKQCLTVTKPQFDYLILKLNEKIEEISKNPNADYYEKIFFELPTVGKYSKNEFTIKHTVSKYIKTLLPDTVSKKYLLDRNTYIKIKE